MSLAYQLKACGRKGLSETLTLAGQRYRQVSVFKHDFFAATALYQREGNGSVLVEKTDQRQGCVLPEKLILKWSRSSDFLGLPLGWLGAWLCRHESYILKRLSGIEGVPRLVGRHHANGLLYGYIEGVSLDSKPELTDDFFDRLKKLLATIHTRQIAYLDMNKRGNILVGADQKPYMIDFQISWYGGGGFWPWRWLKRKLLGSLQAEDYYHLYKHKRRLRRDLMSEEAIARSRRVSGMIGAHRLLTRPVTLLRRRVLGWLMKKGQILADDLSEYHPETDPRRWVNSKS